MIITIDGPAAAGKGTLSEALAQKYHLVKFDTGMLYRAVGLDMVLQNFDVNDELLAAKTAQNLSFAKMIKLSAHPDFRSAIGGQAASIVSAHPKVRQALLKMQQDFATKPQFADGTPAKGVVYDGRDTGTVVCPQAEIKFFVTASSEVRAKRRWLEFQAKGNQMSFDEVLTDIKKRDERDTNRAVAPLKPADDALVLDTSELAPEDVVETAIRYIQQKNA